MSTLALDPGGTCGIAIRTEISTIVTRVTHRPKDLWNLIRDLKPDRVVFENFQTPGHISKDGLYTVRLIGGIEALTYSLKIPTVMQFPNERLQQLEVARHYLKLAQKKYLIHEVDALAHLLVYEDRVSRGVLDQIMQNRRTNEV